MKDKINLIIKIFMLIVFILTISLIIASKISNYKDEKEVEVDDTTLSGTYELGINSTNYNIDTNGIIQSYDEYQNIKNQYQIESLNNEDLLQDSFQDKAYIYYILEIDYCKEKIIDYDIDINSKSTTNIIFYIEKKCGNCTAIPVLYLVPIDKESANDLGNINIKYEYINNYDNNMVPTIDKPILYLYPEEKIKVKVQLKNSRHIITSYPKYNNGWEVVANPNGDLYDANGNYYYALYWDEYYSTKVDFTEGFYVTKESAIHFLEEKLAIIGLNDKERNEFIMYWLPKLEKNEKSLVYFELTEERENNNKLIITPKPDSLLRISIHIKKVEKETKIKEQELTSFERVGFSAIEWGGTVYE